MKASTHGFTLIELSIVLVIIGLIIGGILAGTQLINASTVRAQITQIERYNAAANTFKGKYGYLPGDIKDPDATNFGLTPRGTHAGQGDGNGILEGCFPTCVLHSGFFQNGEVISFWVDLSVGNVSTPLNVNLIDGSFSAATPTTTLLNTAGNIGLYLPSAKAGGGNYVYVYSTGSVNYFGISAVTSINDAETVSGTTIPVVQAYNIDQKVD